MLQACFPSVSAPTDKPRQESTDDEGKGNNDNWLQSLDTDDEASSPTVRGPVNRERRYQESSPVREAGARKRLRQGRRSRRSMSPEADVESFGVEQTSKPFVDKQLRQVFDSQGRTSPETTFESPREGLDFELAGVDDLA